MDTQNQPGGEERRKYVRLDSVFPVQFRLLSLDGKVLLSEWMQGFTNNIGKGGICLEVNNLRDSDASLIRNNQAMLSLKIEMPVSKRPVEATSKPAWVRLVPGAQAKYLIGLAYHTIDPKQGARILRHALTKKFFPPAAIALVVVLAVGLGVNTYFNIKLIKGNKALVNQLITILQDSSIAQQKIKQIVRDKEGLTLQLQSLEQHIQSLEEEKQKRKEEANKIDQLNGIIEKLNKEKSGLQEQMIGLQHKETAVTDQLLDLEKKKDTIEKANFDKMYQWLKVHQNPKTGLVMSFEGDSDISDWGFIYDQSLLVQAYTNFSDFDRAKKILNFFGKKAERVDGRFVNAYYVNDGDPAEFVVHAGPNIWLGIAALQYTKKTQDKSFIKLAEDIGSSIIALQNEDPEGGIRGGPSVTWYATEHNLDAYAFFNMLYSTTGKEQYAKARDKVLDWIVAHTYDKNDVPIKRGKGDSTIATDTYAWSIAAIGPSKLEEIGMNPDRIMEFAQNNCAAEVSFKRPDNQVVTIKGFDFAPQKNVARGGIVSAEWTGQMIVSLKIMADYYYKKDMAAKGRAYEKKAEEYLASLGGMVISSPSPSGQGESCMPYATQDFVDTGHGWMTPKGKSTGSVAGTAYYLFAYYNYNPLELK